MERSRNHYGTRKLKPIGIYLILGFVLLSIISSILFFNSAAISNPNDSIVNENKSAQVQNITALKIDIPLCKEQKPQFEGTKSIGCSTNDIDIDYEYYKNQEQILKAKKMFRLEPIDSELTKYSRSGISNNTHRLMTINIPDLLLINIESTSVSVNQMQQWLEKLNSKTD